MDGSLIICGLKCILRIIFEDKFHLSVPLIQFWVVMCICLSPKGPPNSSQNRLKQSIPISKVTKENQNFFIIDMCMIGNFVELRLFTNFQSYVCPKSGDYNINVNVDIIGLSYFTEHKTSASTFKAYDVLMRVIKSCIS